MLKKIIGVLVALGLALALLGFSTAPASAATGATVCNNSTIAVSVQLDSGSYTTVSPGSCKYNVKRVYVALGKTMRVSWNYIDFGSRGHGWWYPTKGTWRVTQYR